MSIIYCSSCGREINTRSHAYSDSPPLCVNCRGDEKQDAPEINNLESHPRCPQCGCTTWHVVYTFEDYFVLEFTCGENRMGFRHDGKKLDHCPQCAGSDFISEVTPCPYCQGQWS